MPNMYYTKEHEWVKIDGSTATVGISDYAAHQLGDITFVELPKPGKTVKQFEVLCAIESVKAASDIYAPVSGTVTHGQRCAERTRPRSSTRAPEDAAWMATMKMPTRRGGEA